MFTPESQHLVRFALGLAVSEIQHVQGLWKMEMHRMTPNWSWTLNSQKYPTYTYPEAQILFLSALWSAISKI